MSEGYRAASLACPGCGERLDPRSVGEAIVDVCPACGGIWVDWFDGELADIARGAHRGDDGAVREASGSRACPRCQAPLEEEAYMETVATVYRCGDCSGAFVPRSSVHGLVAPGEDRDEPGAWERLVAALLRVLGAKRRP